ncbi:hypothetical protein COLO4_37380 [Corchorus olitorius]|uniref:Uncharacterized protein n=1 Tax=Corchorus olitorius TaxID=93759 RepID=A0A1R3G245_9ROSI|nr:hypothetical protein COLO4_37380 [Corchorus olitorius]
MKPSTLLKSLYLSLIQTSRSQTSTAETPQNHHVQRHLTSETRKLQGQEERVKGKINLER